MAKVEVERRGAITLVVVNRPRVHNCVDAETAELLEDGIVRFASDDAARVLVVTGAGGQAFSSGADLNAAAGLLERPQSRRIGPMGFSGLDPGKPTIAAVEGYCFAGGMELACWCDVRIAGETAEFGALNRRWGVPFVDGGTQRLPRLLGLGNALYLIETGVRLGARKALELGLVQEVVPAGRALERALDLAAAVADYPQASLRADRASAVEGIGHPLEDGLRMELERGLEVSADRELAEGLERFDRGDVPPPPEPAG